MYATMEHEKEENQSVNDLTAAPNAPAEAAESPETFSSELEQAIWSVITHEGVAVSGMTYPEAAHLSKNLSAQKISGICIVTDNAAKRIAA